MCALSWAVFWTGLLFYLAGTYNCWRAEKNLNEADELIRILRKKGGE